MALIRYVCEELRITVFVATPRQVKYPPKGQKTERERAGRRGHVSGAANAHTARSHRHREEQLLGAAIAPIAVLRCWKLPMKLNSGRLLDTASSQTLKDFI